MISTVAFVEDNDDSRMFLCYICCYVSTVGKVCPFGKVSNNVARLDLVSKQSVPLIAYSIYSLFWTKQKKENNSI